MLWGQWCNIAKEAAARTFLVAKFLCLLHVTDTYIVSTSIVHGPSMLPTLNMRGDVILMDKLSHRFGKVEAGDVVFVKSPQNPARVMTKRVLGLEGDVVSLDTRSGIFESSVAQLPCTNFCLFKSICGHGLMGDTFIIQNNSKFSGGAAASDCTQRACLDTRRQHLCIKRFTALRCSSIWSYPRQSIVPDMAACGNWYDGTMMRGH